MAVPKEKIYRPDQCLTMADLRAMIDTLDRKLVSLLAARQRYIERAAEIKVHRNEIRDEARVADVLVKVIMAATQSGLDVEIARAVWRTLMERSIALEMARFEKLNPNSENRISDGVCSKPVSGSDKSG